MITSQVAGMADSEGPHSRSHDGPGVGGPRSFSRGTGGPAGILTDLKGGRSTSRGPRVGECVEVARETQQLVAQARLVGSGKYPGW